MPDFKKLVLQNEVSTKERVFKSDSVYTQNMLKSIINESGDWRQKLKNTTVGQSIHGDVELSSLNANNNIPIIGSQKSATIDLKTGGIIQGSVQSSLLDNLVNANQETQIKDDLEALNYQAAYALDDMVYGNETKYLGLGIYGLVTNPQVIHDSTSLVDTYANSTADDIIADQKEFIKGYFDNINSDNTIRKINRMALDVEIKVPTVIMSILTDREIVNANNTADVRSVLDIMKAWNTRMNYKVTYVEDAGMDLIPFQDGTDANHKVMMIGVFRKEYISLEIPNSLKRVGLQGKTTDYGFDIQSEIATVVYTMQVLGTQIMRTNMFQTRDV